MEYQNYIEEAEENKGEITKLFQRLKKKKPKEEEIVKKSVGKSVKLLHC